jgi:glycosyltransferase involved in cell wall biosynthesis
VRLSVVIPALNEERHLGRLLSDLQGQSKRPDELIVVDAGSSDATVRIAEQSQAVVLHGEPPVARGRKLLREGRGFDPSLKFDDIELVRRLSKGKRFGIVDASAFVSDRRYREEGILRTFLLHLDDFLQGFPRVSREQAEAYLEMPLTAAGDRVPADARR